VSPDLVCGFLGRNGRIHLRARKARTSAGKRELAGRGEKDLKCFRTCYERNVLGFLSKSRRTTREIVRIEQEGKRFSSRLLRLFLGLGQERPVLNCIAIKPQYQHSEFYIQT
jgi:hypothetical protein